MSQATARDVFTPENVKRWRWNVLDFVHKVIGAKPDPQQIKFLMLVATCRSVAVKSGHGTGKTAVLAWLVLWFLFVWPYSRVVATAPTQRQLLDVLWPEIRKWLDRSALKGRLIWYATRITAAGHEETWFATARTSNRPENMQGFHAEHLLVLIDEASGVPQPTMEAIEGVMTTANCKVAMAGNPTRISGMFYDAFHKLRAFYATLTLSSETSTNVDQTYCERLAAKYGNDSNVYRVRALGQFPRGEPDVLINLDMVEAAIVREIEAEGLVAIGCDPARFGDAETAIYWRQGYMVHPPIVRQGIDTSWTTGIIAALVRDIRKETGYSGRIPVMVDATGIGAGVVDQLELQAHALWITVVPVNFGGAGTDEYWDTASAMMGELKESLPLMQLPDDDDTVGQLTTRKYKIMPDGRIKVESKDEMRNRGLASPDRSDALGLCFHSGRNRVTMSDETRAAMRTRRGGG